MKYSAEFTEGG